jgi:hypothetical protein
MGRAESNLLQSPFKAHLPKVGEVFWYMAKARFLLPFLSTLVGCATTSSSDVGQVREVAPGKYAIAVGSNASLKKTLFQSNEGTEEAVSQAGQFCHAKGQSS